MKVNDKYSSHWVSHSSMGDFLKCERAYYLHNVYKRPETGRKISIVNPALSLGIAVHEVLENLANIRAEDRFKKPLLEYFDKSWKKVSGKRGGFISADDEEEVKKRAEEMILRVENNKEPLEHKTIKLKDGKNSMPPNFYLSEKDNIILCGKIDWLIYKPEDDSVHILDFKTGKNEEKEGSLQLPIYQLLLNNLQKRKVSGASYWYIDKDSEPADVALPSLEDSYKKVISVAIAVKEAREKAVLDGPESVFLCSNGEKGCFACRPFEKIIRGEAQYVGIGDMKKDLFIV